MRKFAFHRGWKGILGLTAAAAAAAAIVPATVASGSSSPGAPRLGDLGLRPAAAPVCQSFLATNGAGQSRVLAFSSFATYTSTAFTNLTCGSGTISVPAGKRGLVTVRVDGTVVCLKQASVTNGAWCLGRVLINGSEGVPLLDPNRSDAWAYINSGQSEVTHGSFTRTGVLSCPRRHHGACTYHVTVQVAPSQAQVESAIGRSTVDAEVIYY